MCSLLFTSWSGYLLKPRTRGQQPPKVVCVDPRRTPVAREAERTGGVHLAPRVGTNLALMNALTRELFEHDWVDQQWVDAHTIGVQDLRAVVDPHTPEKAEQICGVAAKDIRSAARIFGESQNVLSTVLQGFYQSHQATASAVAVNNLHLLRGLIGRPGSGVLQMNGQPTAQNNRECGADGDLPGFRNWDNPAHRPTARRSVERGPVSHPALGTTDERDADLQLRRTGLDRTVVDLCDQLCGVNAPIGPDPQHPER